MKNDKACGNMQDWTGNNKSTYVTLGASNHTDKERQVHDFYATDSIAIDLLKSACDIPKFVYEPSCGQGHLSKRLIELGHHVYSTDLIDRGYGEGGIDFLNTSWPAELPKEDCCIITNPPFALLNDFINHALNILPYDAPAFFFIKTLCLEGRKRYESFYQHGYLHTIYQCVDRVMCAKNADFESMRAGGGSAVAYAWYEFRRVPSYTQIKWLDGKDLIRKDASEGSEIQPSSRQYNLLDLIIQ